MKTSTYGTTLAALGLVLFGASLGHTATNVVTCTPAVESSIVTVSPPMMNNVSPDAAIGLKLTTPIVNCVANAAQLAVWVPSKNGTDLGTAASVAIAQVQVKAKGFGTCNFVTPDLGAYTASGTLKIKWLNADGSTNKMKGSQATVRIGGDINTVSVKAEGIVTKGTGVGADIAVQLGFDLANPINGPVLACNTGPYSGPAITQIALANLGSDTLSIDFP